MVVWGRLLVLIAPHYPKAGPKGRRPPMLLDTMLRVYFLQNWYALSDPKAEETLYDSEAMRGFAGIELGDDRILDEITILNFRHLLERHGLTQALFAHVNAHLADNGISLRSGTLGDATRHRHAVLDEEQVQSPRPRDVVHEEGQRLVFRLEGSHRRGSGQRGDTQPRYVHGKGS